MLDWPAVEPADFRCPALWLAGSEDRPPIASIRKREHMLIGSVVQVQVVDGLNHNQLTDEIHADYPTILAFLE